MDIINSKNGDNIIKRFIHLLNIEFKNIKKTETPI